MFFLGKDKKLICDDLTIRPYTLKTLRSLCDLLQDRGVKIGVVSSTFSKIIGRRGHPAQHGAGL